MTLHSGADASVIAATAYYLTAMDSRSDPLARQHLWSLAGHDDRLLRDAHDYVDTQIGSSADRGRDLRAQSLIDDTLQQLHR